MLKAITIVGQTFGRLTVISEWSEKKIRWSSCVCTCGIQKTVRSRHLITGNTTSCGCFRKEVCKIGNSHRTHGMVKSREYHSWKGMKQRCYDKACRDYKNYGARGIKVCDRWFDSFENFFSDMGTRPPNTSIERNENEGHYTPENCRWATAKEQRANQRKYKYER